MRRKKRNYDGVFEINTLVSNLLTKKNIKNNFNQYSFLIKIFNKIDKKFKKHLRPYFYKTGTLYCYVDSPVWHQQYSLLKNEIMEKLNKGYEKKTIFDIRFKVGSFDQIHYIIRGETDEIKKSIKKVRLSDIENEFKESKIQPEGNPEDN